MMPRQVRDNCGDVALRGPKQLGKFGLRKTLGGVQYPDYGDVIFGKPRTPYFRASENRLTAFGNHVIRVFFLRSGFEVLGVAANWIIAFVHDHPFQRVIAGIQKIGDAMREVGPSVNNAYPVSFLTFSPSPRPAPFGLGADFRPEAVGFMASEWPDLLVDLHKPTLSVPGLNRKRWKA